jgi:CBS domain containing-hemolysin-like protein
MSPLLLLIILLLATSVSLFFATLSYALRDFSRVKLGEYLEMRGKARFLDLIVTHQHDLIFLTAAVRLLANLLILLAMLRLLAGTNQSLRWQYLTATGLTLSITLLCSVAIPSAAARYAGESVIGACARALNLLRICLMPVTTLRHAVDDVMRRATGASDQSEPEEFEQEIMSAVEEGEKEGVVDEQEREMIESVIEFRDIQVGQIMTARPEIVALDAHSALAEVKNALEESGHSRIPVYEGTLDHIVGILYARDLLKHLGLPPEQFDIRSAIRPAIYVPESKPLRDLLKDFKAQKVHMAIVLDEYGGTTGLVTIEDILEELVGDITDEHEPTEPAMLRKLDDHTFEADARMYIDDFNRLLGQSLPDDQGYDTLGGYISVAMGRIPSNGSVMEQGNMKITILDAEPQKVNRVRIQIVPQPASPPAD